MEIKIREHVNAQFDNLTGLTIESVHVKDQCVVFLLSGDKYTTVQATCDDDEGYIDTYEQHSDKWLLCQGFSLDFLCDNGLITAKAIEGIENEKKACEDRKLQEERKAYEKLKAKFETAT